MKYIVYQIRIKGEVKYIGYTKDIDQREKQHRSAFKRGVSKPFYNWLRTNNYKGTMVLEPIYLAKTKVEAKRYEMYTILHFFFEYPKGHLLNKVPNISDR